jgi:hypothetical protein
MWRRDEKTTVTCIACGETIVRADAREYDKHGDRWDRREKSFEHLCKPCHRGLCHQPRDGLEALLVDIEEESLTGAGFVDRYYAAIAETAESEKEKRDRGP